METEHNKVKIWDLPTRVFHWTLVILMGLLWWSAESGEMQWHQILAYSLLALIGFRLLWGLIGSETSRFSHFVHHPRVVLDYIKEKRAKGLTPVLGHNPMGGYMVIALLLMISIQLVTGLFATDEIFTEGPLYSLVSEDTSALLTTFHKLNFNLILVLSSIHILAVVVHGLKGDKLVAAMVSGYKRVPHQDKNAVETELTFKSVWIALILLLLLVALVFVYLILPIIQVI
ncbi:cytochrome b/b6 domain-containing protein [Shewanella sp. A25]|nr:cytochrome b/b6 domain-containing protein [Shewanella shenzhenensis]